MLTFGNVRSVLAGVFALLPLTVVGLCQQPRASMVTIESEASGYDSSRPDWLSSRVKKLVFQARGSEVYLENTLIPQSSIDALVAALRVPALTAPEGTNLGISRDWLRQSADELLKHGTPNQQALLHDNFCDVGVATQLLPSLFRFWKSDDYPRLRVTVTFTNGQVWIAESNSYYPFMLPWTVNLNGETRKTYNADISRAIAVLMPIGTLNRERLGDKELKSELVLAVTAKIRGQWNLLDVENRAPGIVSTLQRNFEVDRAEISPYRGNGFGYDDGQPEPHEQNLIASLRKPSLPGITADDVILLFHDGKIEGADTLAERIAPYEALALSVPWLRQYLVDHPAQKLYVRFVHDRSFSAKAMRSFEADMKELGKGSLTREVAAVQDKAALVFLGYGSEWIILPDKRMIFWRHYLPASFLKWRASDFDIKRCANYNQNGGGCVGAIVSAEGELTL